MAQHSTQSPSPDLWDGTSEGTLTFEESRGLFTSHVQRFIDGWLLGEAVRGRAVVYDRDGRAEKTLDLGDASEDIQTTPGGKIWVSYFDEGVYGSGVGSQQGLVCFDSAGNPIFKYFDFAEQNDLPFIDDCYAMNVVSDDEVWLSYYSSFPLVSMRGFKLHRVWKDFGCIDGAFGLHSDSVIFPKCYTRNKGAKQQLLRRTLADSPETEPIEPIDESGATIDGHFRVSARGSHLYLSTDLALYEMARSDF
jgi:hypothetical protein